MLGLYGRFKGLGTAPVNPDEYYLARGVEGILKYGVPAFDCGGLYQRGLGLQYLIALLRWSGLSVELSARAVSAVATLLTLAGSFLLARRFFSRNLALLVVAVLALSVWEIEMGRFGRMYAPFQAVFVWYLVYFFQYVLDKNETKLWGMIALTIAGTLIWEGGIFLALANFVPSLITFAETRRFSRREMSIVAGNALLLGLLFLLVTANLRFVDGQPPFPEGFQPNGGSELSDKVHLFTLSVDLLGRSYFWQACLIAAAACTLPAVIWLWSWRHKVIAMAGLLAMLGAAWGHQFGLAILIAVVLLLLRVLEWQDLFNRRALPFFIALAAAAVFWVTYGLAVVDWPELEARAGSASLAIAIFAARYFAFPDLVSEVVNPWASAVPLLSLLLLVSLGAVLIHVLRTPTQLRTPERIGMLLLILLLVGISLSDPPRHETRYAFFLYPLAIILSVGAATLAIGRQRLTLFRYQALAAVLVLTTFSLTEDVNMRHLLSVDQPQTLFREGMDPALQAHLELRDDVSGIAAWVRTHAEPSQDIVINGVHGFDYYYPGAIRYFFVDERSSNFPDWSCRRGSVDRWSNLPLVHNFQDLKNKAAGYRKAFVVMFTADAERLRETSADNRIALTRGLVAVVVLQPDPDSNLAGNAELAVP